MAEIPLPNSRRTGSWWYKISISDTRNYDYQNLEFLSFKFSVGLACLVNGQSFILLCERTLNP